MPIRIGWFGDGTGICAYHTWLILKKRGWLRTDNRRNAALRRKVANGFNYPPDYAPCWFDPAEADNMIKQMAGAAA